jgi:LPXTG-site transpeptidase (sortase) family protein
MRLLKALERLCWFAGASLMAFFLSQVALGEAERQAGIEAFELAYSHETVPDQSLWSEGRIAAWQESRSNEPVNVRAILTIPDLELEVPVYSDASEFNMDRGAGLIPGTAAPNEPGNIGIAGHRDGYFRALKDIQPGSQVRLQTPAGERRYRIRETLVVDPVDVEVLESGDSDSLTLVTCYPFYFVGSAPQRFIVRAELDENIVN